MPRLESRVQIPSSAPETGKSAGRVLNIQLEKLSGCKRLINIEVAEEEVNGELESAFREAGRIIRIPGFRKGKVPRAILEARFRETIEEDAFRKVIENSYAAALKEKNISPLAPPQVDVDRDSFKRNKPFKFKVTVEVAPDIDLPDYKGLELERERLDITDEIVEKVLEQKRQEQSKLIPVNDRPALRGDFVILEGESSLEGQRLQSFNGEIIKLGDGSLPKEVEEKLVGAYPGQTSEIEFTTPEQKKVLYRLSVKEIKERRLLVIDDKAGAGGSNPFENLDEIRADIRKKLSLIAGKEEERRLEEQAMGELVEKSNFDAPPALVSQQLKHLKAVSEAIAVEGQKADDEKLASIAEEQVKGILIIEEIARREGIAVTDKNEDLRFKIKREKVFELLFSNAVIKDKERAHILSPDEVDLIPAKNRGSIFPGRR